MIIKLALILLSAIILHEYAHGWVAYRCGDRTAKLAGRLTLNPLKHIDPVGTILLPGMLLILRATGHNVFIFGWAKPVPVNFFALRHPKRDMIWVGLAGPAMNIGLALLFSSAMKTDIFPQEREFFILGVFVNLLLAYLVSTIMALKTQLFLIRPVGLVWQGQNIHMQ